MRRVGRATVARPLRRQLLAPSGGGRGTPRPGADIRGFRLQLAEACAGLAALALLGACGGGGGGSETPTQQPNSASVAGLYFGTANPATQGGPQRTFDALILADGRIYGMLGESGGIGTVFFGSGAMNGSSFASSAGGNLATSSGAPLSPATVTFTGVSKTSINGTLSGTGSGMPASFTSSYNAAFEGTPAALSAIAGTYVGNSSGIGRPINLTLTFDGTGAFSGTSSDNCPHTGTLTPNATANVYNVSITFESGCPRRGGMTGHALWSPASGGTPATLTLFMSASDPNSAFALGWIFIGFRF